MFKISPIQDIESQKRIALLCGCEYIPGAFAYIMADNETGEPMGFSQFEITEEGGILLNISPRLGYDDFEAMLILGKSTMNFIDLCGAHTLYAEHDAGEKKLLHAMGLKLQDDGSYFCNMTGFFNGDCCCDHQN